MSREIWKILLSAGMGTVISACQKQTLSPFIATDTATPVSRPPATATAEVTKTLTPTPAPTETPTSLPTQDIKRVLFEAKEGEVMVIKNAKIGYIVRFPWLFGYAYLATISTGNYQAAVVLSSQCVYDALRDNNLLGIPHGEGSWKPDATLDSLELKILSPYSVASPRPILDVKTVVQNGKVAICKEESALDQLKDFIKSIAPKINWDNLPKDIENKLWKLFTLSRSGFDSFRTPTPKK